MKGAPVGEGPPTFRCSEPCAGVRVAWLCGLAALSCNAAGRADPDESGDLSTPIFDPTTPSDESSEATGTISGALPATFCAGGDCNGEVASEFVQCGDGVLDAGEACDDGNALSGDGCSGDCLSVGAGYSCNPPGELCRAVALCGNGAVSSNEMCDDGNALSGDGCSAGCQLELGYRCDGEPSACKPTTCGDGVVEGRESCDDGNRVPFDGCSSTCQAEPDCRGEVCSSECGDGLVLDEACDDGNRLSGDGCSSECTLEEGFECSREPGCEPTPNGCALRVPVVYRDFTPEHVDFRCGGGTGRPVVLDRLSPEGKPVLVDGGPGCIQSPQSFGEWFVEAALNRTIPSSLLLFESEAGSYVNRHGEAGERWVDLNGAELDGNPVFLPIDDAPEAFGDGRIAATVAPEYSGDQNWHAEADFVQPAELHNFLFTTEVQYWFRYDPERAARLDFLGDDDVWVFVNGTLALDLGGLHVPQEGAVEIGADTAPTYALEPGGVYAIKVFQAERNPTGSSLKLTLSGFELSPTACRPICGDGIVTLGEECDDGRNDGGYGECAPGCRAGPRCGDGVVQAGEQCDDGNRVEGDGCGSSCQIVVLR